MADSSVVAVLLVNNVRTKLLLAEQYQQQRNDERTGQENSPEPSCVDGAHEDGRKTGVKYEVIVA